MASPTPKLKVLLFDIGGVCVLSPFEAIASYEQTHNIPHGYINHAISRSSPNGSWQRLERGELPLSDVFFTGFAADLQNPETWASWHARGASSASPSSRAVVPPLPRIDAEDLFWTMMAHSRTPDPFILPALRRLRASGRYLIAALSNTVTWPEGHEYNHPRTPEEDVRGLFDVFVGSAEVGMRKPEGRIYEFALEVLEREWRRRQREGMGGKEAEREGEGEGEGEGLKPEEVLFLDDIGENLKGARRAGMRTLKVNLGRTREAVVELERVTGLKFLDDGGGAMGDTEGKAKL